MTLEINAINGVQEIISKITNSTFQITLKNKKQIEIVSYQIMPQLNDGRMMGIKLRFRDAGTVSGNSELDQVEVIVKESLYARLPSS